ncbi:hypothetical protein BA011_33960 (plasmid) [Rhizobium leguminosarum]|uniref:Uncharacterized protein n=1 Tax=Rhizobium leguminosarum TaxID=384 RepID=A0A179C0G6_RHILE|nr:hypothetical protein BA011_33960 [Rhizobium leguminosarum]OAP96804.1 hypothetical protein A4U53_37705 [Rhizobium leguminosarum]
MTLPEKANRRKLAGDGDLRMTDYLRHRRPVRHCPGSGRDLAALVSRRTRSDLACERRNVLR